MCRATKCWLLLRRCSFLLFFISPFPSRVINTMLTAEGFTTLKCRLDTRTLTVSTHGQTLRLSVSHLSGHADVCIFHWHVRSGYPEMTARCLRGLPGYFYHSECNLGRCYNVAQIREASLTAELCLLVELGGTALWWLEISIEWGDGGRSSECRLCWLLLGCVSLFFY